MKCKLKNSSSDFSGVESCQDESKSYLKRFISILLIIYIEVYVLFKM